jgi:energy-coupling factor transporter transmembrane protein EcfT
VWQLLRRGNLDYFDKALQFSLPPRIVLLGLLILINMANLVFPNPAFQWWWLAAFVLVILTLLISVPKKYYSMKTLKALLSLPKVFILMILILLRIRSDSKKFNPTEHTYSNQP